jgi:peptidyl-prolyl cis-trans isomerase B (cyclophilin B)
MIKHITTFLAISIFIAGCGSKEKGKESIMDKENAVISTQFGDIVVEFFDDIAPKHVESFKLHAQNGYYNGTTFHRVIPGFMIQGGDPLTRSDDRSRHGTGGNAAKYFGIGTESDESTWDLPAEFSPTPHERGILSMARSQNPDSGGSQFFICVADARFLDNQYTVFGKVVSGMDAVDAIVSAPRDARDNPNDRIEMKVHLEDKK